MRKIVFALLFLVFLIFPQNAFAEKINSFDVTVTASKDGLAVAEEAAGR